MTRTHPFAHTLLVSLVSLVCSSDLVAQQTFADTPFLRWQFFYEQRAYPFNAIPSGALQRAREAVDFQWPAGFSGRTMAAPWTPLGPQRIPVSKISTGRIAALAVHPTDGNTVYVGGAQGGVWKTVDGGTNWTPLTETECSLAMGALAIDPANPNIVYAGTGEQNFSGDSYYGCGVLRSVDGGTTWTQLGGSTFSPSTGGARIGRIVIDPVTAGSPTTTTLLAASDFGLYRSNNSGLTWVEVLDGVATDIVLDPTDPAIAYATLGRPSSTAVNGVYKSTNGGLTWTKMSAGLPTTDVGRINLAISPSDPGVLYISIHRDSNNALMGIFKSFNGAATWSQLTASGASCSTQCWYNMAIAVHPLDADTVIFGGVDLYRSTDGGGSFSSILDGIHVDQHVLVYDPQDPDVVYVGNDGGVYRSANGGASWTSLNTNLALTQFYPGITPHPSNPQQVIGGTQDNGTLQYTGTADWNWILGGDGGFTAIDFDNPSVMYAETQWNPSFGGPRRRDGAGSFTQKNNGITMSDNALFIPPLVMDHTDPHTLYFGTGRVYKTINRGDSWFTMSPNLTGGLVSIMAPTRADPEVLYVGTSQGNIHLTTNGGTSWNLASTGIPNRYVRDIDVRADNAAIAVAVVSGFNSGHVFRTTNFGAAWNDISGNLPNVPVNAVLIDPGSPDHIIVGTDLGIFETTNLGTTWTPMNDGLPLMAVFDLALGEETGTLVAATHGRGMFSQSLTVPLSIELGSPGSTDSVPLGGVSATGSVLVRPRGTGGANLSWTATTSAPWISFTNAMATGKAQATWDRDAQNLGIGTHIADISITGPGVASPAMYSDTVVVESSIMVDQPLRGDTVSLGGTLTSIDSVALTIAGGANWTAAVGAGGSWITLLTPSGTGSGFVRWTRDAAALTPGRFGTSITITGAQPNDITVVADSVLVTPNITDVIDALLHATALPTSHTTLLDQLGNGDAIFNLGDVIALIDLLGGTIPPTPLREAFTARTGQPTDSTLRRLP